MKVKIVAPPERSESSPYLVSERSMLTRFRVLRLDWWFHSRFPLYFPANVDRKVGKYNQSIKSWWSYADTSQEYDESGPSIVHRKCF